MFLKSTYLCKHELCRHASLANMHKSSFCEHRCHCIHDHGWSNNNCHRVFSTFLRNHSLAIFQPEMIKTTGSYVSWGRLLTWDSQPSLIGSHFKLFFQLAYSFGLNMRQNTMKLLPFGNPPLQRAVARPLRGVYSYIHVYIL